MWIAALQSISYPKDLEDHALYFRAQKSQEYPKAGQKWQHSDSRKYSSWPSPKLHQPLKSTFVHQPLRLQGVSLLFVCSPCHGAQLNTNPTCFFWANMCLFQLYSQYLCSQRQLHSPTLLFRVSIPPLPCGNSWLMKVLSTNVALSKNLAAWTHESQTAVNNI